MNRFALKQLLAWKSSPVARPLIVQGARQVGKTFLLKRFAEESFRGHYYLNFEEIPELKKAFSAGLSPERILQDLGLQLKRDIKNDPEHLLILDEIQSCPEALTSLKYFSENKLPLRVCAAGSLLGLQMSHGSFPVGKVDTLSLAPLTFREFLEGVDEQALAAMIAVSDRPLEISEFAHQKLWEQFKLYLVIGGLPDVINTYNQFKSSKFKALSAVRTRQRELTENYLNDIAKHSGKLNALHIEAIWNSIYRQLGRTQDDSVKRFRFKDALPGIGKFERMVGPIDWLCKARLALRVPLAFSANEPVSAHTRENIFKLFYFDVGILGSIAGLGPETILDYSYGTYKGFFAENFVAQELRAYGKDKDLVSWNEGTAEIEFLLSASGESSESGSIVPVEVKSGNVTKAKSLAVFLKKYNPKRAVILSGKPPELKPQATIQRLPLYCCEYLAGKND